LKRPGLFQQSVIIFLSSLFLLFIFHQLPFTYKVEIGSQDDNWNIRSGFGEREKNDFFAFRWTIDSAAQLRIPDVGFPSRIGVVGVAPRPDNSSPLSEISTNGAGESFSFSAEKASYPPDKNGRLTFETSGAAPALNLTANKLYITAELFQPKGDPRSLGLAISQVYVKPVPGRFGVVLPPLAWWFGSALIPLLLFLLFTHFQEKRWRYIGAVLGLACLVILRIIAPEWNAVNVAGIVWGVAIPLIVYLIAGNKKAEWLILTQIAGIMLVFYGMTLAPFTLSLLITAGLLSLVLGWKNGFRQHAPNLAFLISISAGTAWGLWQGQLPRSDDIPNYHLYWINELDRLMRMGNLYPRWASSFSWGLGNATFNFYPPLARYLPELFHLQGMSFNSAVMFTQHATLVFGMFGSYFWAASLLGDRRAALVAGVAFGYFPFNIAYIYEGGGLSNSYAGALFPWFFWQLGATVQSPEKRSHAVCTGIFGAALALSNLPQLLLAIPLTLIYLVCLIFACRFSANPFKPLLLIGNLVLAGALAFGLSAFFLLSAFLEKGIAGLAYTGQGRDFYARLPENLALWRPLFPNMTNYALLGTLHYLLALCGFILLLTLRTPKIVRFNAGILLGLLAITFFFQLPSSSFFWDSFQLFSSVQFTSRLLSPAAAFASPLIAALVTRQLADKQEKRQALIARSMGGIIIIALMAYGCFNNFNVAYWSPTFDGSISLKALTEQVNKGDIMYLPSKLVDINAVTRYIEPTFNDKRVTGQNENLKWESKSSDTYLLTAVSSTPANVTIPLFWYDNWWKAVDEQGREYVLQPTAKTSLVTLDIPNGTNRITIKLQDSAIRVAGNLISILTFLILVASLILASYRRKGLKPKLLKREQGEVERKQRRKAV